MINYKKLAFTDIKMNCYNRNYYEYVVKRKWNKKELSILYFDLDNLKVTNDELGHLAGDNLLFTFVLDLKECFGKNVIRVGGDEFIVIIDNLDKMLNMKYLKKRFEHCSFGLSIKHRHNDIESVVNDAENKMYAMKRSKKNV